MIVSFRCKETERLFSRYSVRRWHDVTRVAMRKLASLHAAEKLDDLRSPPANRLEPLKGNRQGQYSIRINRQWRLCFVWDDGNAHDVEIVDYH